MMNQSLNQKNVENACQGRANARLVNQAAASFVFLELIRLEFRD
jgi:hypothetical protein